MTVMAVVDAQNPGLKIMMAPKRVEAFSYVMVSHLRLNCEAAHIWLRHFIVEVAGTIKETAR